jgi:HAD superfamily hydrolase (TIGR01450 family)
MGSGTFRGVVVRNLNAYAAYLFDVDGTLIYPERAVPGAAEALAALKARGKAVVAVTNNSSLSRRELGDRFRAYGLPLEDEEVFSALAATARFVANEAPGARVHVFGNRGLRAEIERLGLVVTEDIEVDYVVVGTYREITYDRLTQAMRALLHGARLVAVNADRMYVGADGGMIPGAGVFLAALERAVGRSADIVIGKPSVTLLLEAADSVGLTPRDCLYIGDNPEADIAGAHAAGMDALLVLSGVASAADAEECPDPPEHVLPSVADLIGVV